MFKKIALLGTICVLASAMSASADTIFSLTTSGCSSGCNVLPAGTVTLHQNGTNDVFVTVQLGTDYSFRQANDSNHHGFVFDLSGVSGVSATNVSSPFAFQGFGSYNDSPFGTFQYDFECTTCGAGVPVTPTQTLTFDLIGLGLLESSFVSNGSGFFFAADVVGLDAAAGVGLTGNIGATDPTTPPPPTVPEPSSLLMFGTGLVAAAGALRRRLMV